MTIREKKVRARKTHYCMICGSTINIGEECMAQTNCDGGIYTVYYHCGCHKAFARVIDEGFLCRGEVHYPEDIRDAIMDFYYNNSKGTVKATLQDAVKYLIEH